MSNLVRLIGISRGAEFEIDVSAFSEAEPVFAYVDDLGGSVEPLRGLVVAGRTTIHDRPPFMWLNGPRDCVLLKTSAQGTREGRVAFRSLSVGEFCLEIYHLRPEKGFELIHANDFCFK